MTFCASVHLYFCENPQKVFQHEKLRSCLPVACGLLYCVGRNLVSLISQLQEPSHNEKSLLKEIYGKQNLLLHIKFHKKILNSLKFKNNLN